VTSNSAASGGALYYGSADACEVIGNTASVYGGGAWAATLRDSSLILNSGPEGGATYDSVLYRCTLATNTATRGGGAYGTMLIASRLRECRLYGNSATEGGGGWGTMLDRCLLLGNSASTYGGGAYQGALTNCLIVGGSAVNYGGGAYYSTLVHCTLSGNYAEIGGGAFRGAADNSVLYFNSSVADGANYYETALQHSCADPLDPGTGNIDADPQFVDAAGGNYRLRYGSPCLDVATAVAGISSDLDGNPRPLDWNADGTNAPDMGCYEYNPMTADSNADSIPDWWCLKYLFDPNSDAVAAGNADDDPHNNLQEWLADTNPTNGASRLCITALDLTSTPRVFFPSSASRMYSLEWTTDLVNQPWTNVPGLIPRAGGSAPDWFDDASHSGVTNIFYRIRASLP
jgi:hypothetical protein